MNNNLCLICSGEANIFLADMNSQPFNVESLPLHKKISICTNCGYKRDISVNSLDQAIKLQSSFISDNTSSESIKLHFYSREHIIVKKIEKLIPKKSKIIDIGCNRGFLLNHFSCNHDKYGLELSENLALQARFLTGANIISCPVENYSGSDCSYDLVYSMAVIEHIFDPIAFFDSCYKLCKPGGLIVIMTGDSDSIIAKKMGWNWPLYISSDHISFFSAKSLVNLSGQYKLEVIDQEWRFFWFSFGLGNFFVRSFMKILDIFGIFTRTPYFDHYYIYLRKR